MNFWVISPNVTNNAKHEPQWKEAIFKYGFAFMGWDEDHNLGKAFNKIKIGDFILVAQGANWQKNLLIGGIVNSDALSELVEGTPCETYFRKLNPLLSIEDLESLDLDFNGSAYGEANRIPALYQLHPDSNPVDLALTEKLQIAINEKIKTKKMKDLIDVLIYKKQIILQGPPGTGKTFTAQLMANEMIKSKKKLSPLQYIEQYIKNYVDNKQTRELKASHVKLLNEFWESFPKEELNKLALETYCVGKGSKDNFCPWIEIRLRKLGHFFPGQTGASVYGIYYSQDDNKYLTSKIEGTPAEAMATLAKVISELVNTKKTDNAKKYLRKGLILKILNSYYPEEYFPIYSHSHLRIIAKLFEFETKNIDEIEINKKINEKFKELKKAHSSAVTNYELMELLYDKFNIKDNSETINEIETVDNIGESKIIQFHPAYSYEDFVRGISATTNNKNQIEYKVQNRILAEFAEKALRNPNENYVLVIDEINRANLPAVLGELIYILEYRFDEDKQKETTVDSIYAIKRSDDDLEGDRTLRLPSNLYIIGTMNTADRSAGHIDYAIRRRFSFMDILPVPDPVHPLVKDLFQQVSSLFIENFDSYIQEKQTKPARANLAADFRPEDVWIGHSYFICRKDKSDENEDDEKARPILKNKLKYEVAPLLKEYIKDGILFENEQVQMVIEDLYKWE